MINTVKEIFKDYDDGKLEDEVLLQLVGHYRDISSEKETPVSIGGQNGGEGFRLDDASRVRLGKSKSKRFEMISNGI